MALIGNIIWFICGGAINAVIWTVAGILYCITVIGIPFGLQCFKFARLSAFPFGKEIVFGGGAISFIANIIWWLVPGLEMAIFNAVLGCIFSITIIGIPLGKVCFRFAKLALMPFGARIVKKR